MIKMLYRPFQEWCKTGRIFIISDTHFDDPDTKIMDPSWITPEEHIRIINKVVHKNDTLIHLGDVGNPEYMNEIKAHKVLLMGNHDETVSKFEPYFDEIYKGPLLIAEKILLSHEPVTIPWCVNVHGHAHNGTFSPDENHVNLAADVVGFKVFCLDEAIKNGLVSNIRSLHRITIDNAAGEKK